ncbi:MAG: SDR family oxidoreductase [Planctomycetota bacterium]
MSTSFQPTILLTGPTGYVGGRLLKRLEALPVRVRCLARNPEYLEGVTGKQTEVVRGDVLDRSSLAVCLDGVDTAYYLVHSMASAEWFEQKDREAAENFAAEAKAAGVKRIVYLGGLADDEADLSPHMRSRHEVGQLLRTSGCAVTEFRASIIIGSGSLSFELIRSLVIRLPVMVTPQWVSVEAQPIAIDDVLDYLVAALTLPEDETRIYEIGGPQRVSYAGIMREYARQTGRRRLFIPVPVLSTKLSSLWLGLVTPVYARVGRKLIEGLRHPSVVRDDAASSAFEIQPRDLESAIDDATLSERELDAPRWGDSTAASVVEQEWSEDSFLKTIQDDRSRGSHASPEAAFAPIRRIGGPSGWYFATWLWRVRGWLDLLVGGVGMRRGRRNPDQLRVGDVVDCWRVAEYEPNRRLKLVAEMRVPGKAWLEFSVAPTEGGSTIRQTATYRPVGTFGVVYWYAIWPVHVVLFSGMLREIVRRGESPTAA